MLNTIFAKKVAQKQMYSPAGKRLGVTVLAVPEVKFSGLRTTEKHGYCAMILEVDGKQKEVRTETTDFLDWREIIKVGDIVAATGISKGKGFAGVVKRYHFKGGPRTHGQSNRERARGSSGPTTTPGRVLPGKRMAGRMGNDTVTVKGLEVVGIDPEKKLLILNGSIPGKKTGLVRITKTI